jgi:hypothetical protein
MIIGNGDIANVLKGHWFESSQFVTIFASGVSDSKCKDPAQFERERNLLLTQEKSRHLVYFSTLSIYYPGEHNEYIQHKIRMEEIVKECFESYTIVRIGNITWGKNPNTLLNFLRLKMKKNENFEVRDEYRYLINEQEFLHWMNNIQLLRKDIISLTGNLIKVTEIVEKIKKNEM